MICLEFVLPGGDGPFYTTGWLACPRAGDRVNIPTDDPETGEVIKGSEKLYEVQVVGWGEWGHSPDGHCAAMLEVVPVADRGGKDD